jgi:hypothetical protein
MVNVIEIVNKQSNEECVRLLVKKNNSGMLVEFAKNLLSGKGS